MSGLRRGLSLRDLILYGLVIIQPTAPMAIYGVIQQETRGQAVFAIALAMIAVLFTAVSYGRMAAVYPSAGSAFTYVTREVHPMPGFLAGWCLLLDYVLNPTVCVIWASKAAMNIAPGIPFYAWAILFAVLFTSLNARNIEFSAGWNKTVAAILSGLVILVLAACARFIYAAWPVSLAEPVSRLDWNPLVTGASVAVLTFIGFDAISTLSEEVEDPRRNVLRATLLTCLIVGILSILEVYAAQLVWPDYASVPDVDTAYVHVAGRAGGSWLFQIVNAGLLLATAGSGIAAQLAGSRLLYGMGRDGLLPAWFAQLHPATQSPLRNVVIIGAVAWAGSMALSFQLAAEMLNFGAFIGFIGVNAAAFRYSLRTAGWTAQLILPALGAIVCGYVWLNLRALALTAGFAWLAAGAAYYFWRRKSRTAA